MPEATMKAPNETKSTESMKKDKIITVQHFGYALQTFKCIIYLCEAHKPLNNDQYLIRGKTAKSATGNERGNFVNIVIKFANNP